MPPVVIDVRSAEDSRDVVHRAVQSLVEGKLVAFPTETCYTLGASALLESAAERLVAAQPAAAGAPFLAVKSAEEAQDYLPQLGLLGRRLARRCWPGPLTLAIEDNHPESLLTQLAPSIRRLLTPNGQLRLRVPGHPLFADVLRMLVGPIVAAPIHTPTGLAFSVAEVLAEVGDKAQLVLDDGRSRYGQPESIVEVGPAGLTVQQAGVVSEQALKRLASMMVLFVCTGNTCRSPMAERMCRKLIADRLGCKQDEVQERGVLVVSAGTAAVHGGRASREAVEVLAQQGIPLADHESQPLTEQLVRNADLILVMTGAHRQLIVREWPEAAERTHLLCSDRDVLDPIGGPQEEYRQCAEQIQQELRRWVDRLEL
jgi:tRNA threonylcarbamoyl adenosine modification protein (Sua5/YciO/YrdC/YwlC family)